MLHVQCSKITVRSTSDLLACFVPSKNIVSCEIFHNTVLFGRCSFSDFSVSLPWRKHTRRKTAWAKRKTHWLSMSHTSFDLLLNSTQMKPCNVKSVHAMIFNYISEHVTLFVFRNLVQRTLDYCRFYWLVFRPYASKMWSKCIMLKITAQLITVWKFTKFDHGLYFCR